jgi:alpha-mannosidase
LKVAFPADLTAPVLRGEIQFGHVIRPTHRNTEFERQRFEWPAQKWADLSEARYGIAVLNDCKYGYDILGGVLRLTLLRAPIAPDPTADRGLHEFVYALYVHDGGFAESGVVRAAYDLNVPVTVATGAVKHEGDLVAISHPAVVCETIKAGEDGAGLVLRLYEAAGSSARAVVRVAGAYRSARLTNMLEEPARRLALAGGAFELSFRPFEVKTVKLV